MKGIRGFHEDREKQLLCTRWYKHVNKCISLSPEMLYFVYVNILAKKQAFYLAASVTKEFKNACSKVTHVVFISIGFKPSVEYKTFRDIFCFMLFCAK